MLLENYVLENRQAFTQKVATIARALQVNPDWLMLVMYHESRFNHKVINGIGCVGLIQFCPIGALQMFGLTAQQMANMTNVQQLDYVYKFFKPMAGQMHSFRDMHLYAFYPAAYRYRNNPNYIFGSEGNFSPQLIAQQNKVFDINNNGVISMGDFTKYDNDFARKHGASVVSNSSNKLLLLSALFYLFYDDF